MSVISSSVKPNLLWANMRSSLVLWYNLAPSAPLPGAPNSEMIPFFRFGQLLFLFFLSKKWDLKPKEVLCQKFSTGHKSAFVGLSNMPVHQLNWSNKRETRRYKEFPWCWFCFSKLISILHMQNECIQGMCH